MPFSTAGCDQSGGISIAAQQVTDELTLAKQTAVNHLTLARDVGQELAGFSFDETVWDNDYSGSGTLSQLGLSSPTAVNYAKLVYGKPNDSIADNSGSLTQGTDTDLYLPFLDSGLIQQLIDTLCDILENGFQGLDQCYEAQRWNRARDQATRETDKQTADIAVQFGVRGWPVPCGPEIKMRDLLYEAEARKLADESRDIAFKVYDTAIEIFILALNAVVDYFASWEKIYDAWIKAQTQRSTIELQQARLQIERMRAQIRIYQTKIANERARVGTQAAVYRTDIGAYGTEIEQSNHALRADQAEFGHETTQRDLEARKNRQHNRADAQDQQRDTQELLTVLRSQMDALTRSVMAQYQSISFRAAMNSSVGSTNGRTCNTSYTQSETVTL